MKRDQIEKNVRTVILYYIDLIGRSDTEFLLMCLDGGKIPSTTAEVLRPFKDYLSNSEDNLETSLTQANFDELKNLSKEIELLNAKKRSIKESLKSAIDSLLWSQAELELAKKFKMDLLPANERVLDILSQEVALCTFNVEEIISVLHNQLDIVKKFSSYWYADCNKLDYGEEWNPEEDDQQDEVQEVEVLGIGQGFMVNYIILFLYAKNGMDGLIDYLKLTKTPYAKKVVRGVKRVYKKIS